MIKVFVDSFYLIALQNPLDDFHLQALQKEEDLGDEVLRVVTHEVFIEFLAATRSTRLRRMAAETVEAMKADPSVKVIPPSAALFDRGLARYRHRPDKEYSLVDCISIIVMEEEGIQDVLTNDHHFEQEGFRILLR